MSNSKDNKNNDRWINSSNPPTIVQCWQRIEVIQKYNKLWNQTKNFLKNTMNNVFDYKTNILWADSTLRKYYNTTEDETDKVGCRLILKLSQVMMFNHKFLKWSIQDGGDWMFSWKYRKQEISNAT